MTAPLTEPELAALDALAAEATPGPWRAVNLGGEFGGACVLQEHVAVTDGVAQGEVSREDGAFIAASSPDVVRRFVAAAREHNAARAEVARLRAANALPKWACVRHRQHLFRHKTKHSNVPSLRQRPNATPTSQYKSQGDQVMKKSIATKSPTKAKASVRATKPRAVLVTTAHRGVFFGYATKTDGDTIKLSKSRLCVYWSTDVKGFMGLASDGPSASCRIGPPADIELRSITAVAEVTDAAVAKWEASPWRS